MKNKHGPVARRFLFFSALMTVIENVCLDIRRRGGVLSAAVEVEYFRVVLLLP